MSSDLDDERMARQLHFALNGSLADETTDEDADIARRLQDEESVQNSSEADAALAAALAAELCADQAADDARDAAFAAALAAEDRATTANHSADDESASLALALSLAEDKPERRRAPPRRDEQLRQHLFSGGAAPTAEPPSSWAPPPIREGGSGPSFASVLGDSQQPPRGLATANAPPAAQPTAARRIPPAPRAPHASGPLLILDGANVGYAYGAVSRAPSGFDAEGIRKAVDYFSRRAPPGRRVPLSGIAVTLSETRWDPSSSALTALHDDAVLAWTPIGKDDDVFLLQCAADHGAWVVTNDRWTDHRASRHATAEVRRRVLRYAFVGGSFAPASDALARFDASGGAR